LFAELWVVKARNAARNQPPAGQRSRGGLSSKLHLRVEIGGRPLMIPVTAASAIRRAVSWSAQDAPRHAARGQNPRQPSASRRDSSRRPYWSPLLASLAKRPADTPRLSAICMHARYNTDRQPAALPSTRNRPRTAVQGCVLRPLCTGDAGTSQDRQRSLPAVSPGQPGYSGPGWT
jgi:hypothetical protein